jgi:hypothetical protein
VASLSGAQVSVKSAAERALPLFAQVFGYPASELESTGVAELSAALARESSGAVQASRV